MKWRSDEINIIRIGLFDIRRKHSIYSVVKSISRLLPYRSWSSIRSKINSMRKYKCKENSDDKKVR